MKWRSRPRARSQFRRPRGEHRALGAAADGGGEVVVAAAPLDDGRPAGLRRLPDPGPVGCARETEAVVDGFGSHLPLVLQASASHAARSRFGRTGTAGWAHSPGWYLRGVRPASVDGRGGRSCGAARSGGARPVSRRVVRAGACARVMYPLGDVTAPPPLPDRCCTLTCRPSCASSCTWPRRPCGFRGSAGRGRGRKSPPPCPAAVLADDTKKLAAHPPITQHHLTQHWRAAHVWSRWTADGR